MNVPRAPTRSASRPTGVDAHSPSAPAIVMPTPTWPGERPTDRVRKIAQLEYHAPLPTAEARVPAAMRRRAGVAGTAARRWPGTEVPIMDGSSIAEACDDSSR